MVKLQTVAYCVEIRKYLIAQHGEIQIELHTMVKFTNSCKTWWNSQTVAKHGEIHKQLYNNNIRISHIDISL